MSSNTIVLVFVVSVMAVALSVPPSGAEGPTRTNASPEVVIPADSAGVVYILGMLVAPPFRLTLRDRRVQVNGLDVEPDSRLVPPSRFSVDPAVIGILEEMQATTFRIQARADSLISWGTPRREVSGAAAAAFLASPHVTEARILEGGDLEVTWTGIPGRQFVGIGPSGRDGRPGGVVEPPPETLLDEAACLMRRGNLFASGIGYRVSLFGELADSLLAAIVVFNATGADTLRVGPRRFTEFGEDLRRAREAMPR
jgi:hypothetical protein